MERENAEVLAGGSGYSDHLRGRMGCRVSVRVLQRRPSPSSALASARYPFHVVARQGQEEEARIFQGRMGKEALAHVSTTGQSLRERLQADRASGKAMGFIKTEGGFMEPEPASEIEDNRILQFARELCVQLGFENLSPERLSWQEQYSRRGRWSQDKYGNPLGPYVTPHFPLFYQRTLILRPIMQGRLGTEEWRPLLASSLIFYGQLRSRVNRRSALVFAPMLVLMGVLLFGLWIRNSMFSNLSVVFTLTALIIGAGVGGAYSSLLVQEVHASRRQRGC